MTEILAHLLYRVWEGEFLWETQTANYSKAQDVFSVRDFIYRVDDERFFTTKPNYVYTKAKTHAEGEWSLATDENGFRLGTYHYSTDKPNIVFLGDSVPFGWDVENDDTAPSKFYDLLWESENEPAYGVINAAIPSYALYQAIKRYEYELYGHFPVKYVILQTYDPVAQFEKFGREWQRNLNWYTQRWTTVTTSPLLRYSALYWLVNEGQRVLLERQRGLQAGDTVAFEHFRAENMASLDELYTLLKSEGATLILLPATVPEAAKRDKSEAKQAAIAAFNDILADYAAQHADVYFFDVESRMSQFAEEAVFLDDCCHLSAAGATIQAEFILAQLVAVAQTSPAQEDMPLAHIRPPSRVDEAVNYLLAHAAAGDAIIGLPSTKYFQQQLQLSRQDLIYFDEENRALPAALPGRWYIFFGAENIPERWQQDLNLKRFDYVLLAHRPGECVIEDCLDDTRRLFTELAQANPNSILAQKINNMLSGLANLLSD